MGYEFPHGNNVIIAQVLQEQGRDKVDEDEDSNGDEKQRKLCGHIGSLCLHGAALS